jgi:hypothetical protein
MIVKLSLTSAVAAAALLFAAAPASADPWAFEWPQKNDAVSINTSPDAFERAALADQRSFERAVVIRELSNRFDAVAYPELFASPMSGSPATAPVDHHDRVDALPGRAPVSVPTTDGLEWPQLGIGFGMGALLALGLMLTLRAVRTRQLAH